MFPSSTRPNSRRNVRYRFTKRRWHTLLAVVDWLGWMAVGCAALFKRRRATTPIEPRAILLVQLDHLGDAVLTTTMLPALRRRYPTARLDVLCSAWNREVFALCPEVDGLHVSRSNRFSRRRAWLWPLGIVWWGWMLQARRYDLAIDVRGEAPLAALLWLTGAWQRLGWDCGGGGFLLTDSARYEPNRHEMASRLALLASLGIEARRPPLVPRPKLNPGSVARSVIGRRLEALGRTDRPLVVLHIGAGTRAKRWPSEHWRELLGRIALEFDARVVLVGGAGESRLARDITFGQNWPGVADWTGQTDVAQLAALAERADVFVGADSGPAHLAAAVGTSAIVLFSGATDPRIWRPIGESVAVLRQPTACTPCHRTSCPLAGHPCMSKLLPEEVISRMHRLLDKEPVSPTTIDPTFSEPSAVPQPHFLAARLLPFNAPQATHPLPPGDGRSEGVVATVAAVSPNVVSSVTHSPHPIPLPEGEGTLR